MKNLLTVALFLLALKLFGQDVPPPSPSDVTRTPPDTADEVLVFAEEMPQFPGGQAEFTKYLQTNIHYPDSSKKYGREGTVYIYFEVRKDGKIQNVKCMRGVANAPDLTAEAIRVIKAMPDWEPGKMNGRNVTVGVTIPLRFTLTQ
jgi:protein TonB